MASQLATYDLFLAHPSADKPSARALYDLLQPDVRAFLDERSLPPGAHWDQEIPAAQRASQATVVLISSHPMPRGTSATRSSPRSRCIAPHQARTDSCRRFAAVFCLIEVYSQAFDAEEFRACLAKHLISWQGRMRKTRADNKKRSELGQPPEAFVDPFLWIIAAGAPASLLTELEIEPAPDWPAGVYRFGADVLRVGIVVASKLPRDSTTLLVRMHGETHIASNARGSSASREVLGLERCEHLPGRFPAPSLLDLCGQAR
jgi:hypothetical protein